MQKKIWYLIAICAIYSSCVEKNGTLFKKLPVSYTSIHFKNTLKNTPELNILTYLYYYNGAGVAAADFNGDELVDLYFTSNQGEDKLYINQGNLKFKDITKAAGIENASGWTTGVAHVDINNDGLLDIYICKVGNYKSIKGKNLLYVNQGTTKNGVPIFKEQANSYGIDFSGFSTQAAFFDYDLDGDLDMYLLNHSVYPNRTYGKGSNRTKVDTLSGDRLYENKDSQFIDVTGQSGIFQGKIGYGLGLAISDLNNDGYPDIYVGNDFFENDYLYLNQTNGTFEEIISKNSEKLGHTSHFSMGNDIADINNDGLTDIISLDMLPENLETYKTSGLEYAYPTYQNYLKNGYAPQYMQNTLHLNLGNGSFSEIATLAGISASEWSWGSLFADFDNDGHKDLYISNGIKGATNDMDFINFIANDKIQKKIEAGMNKEDMSFIKNMPKKKVSNYFFKNRSDLTFENVTDSWFYDVPSYSNGSAYADLDNDGDLDLIVNNIDDNVFILENQSEKIQKTEHHYLKIRFYGNDGNTKGIGAKVIAHVAPNTMLFQENFTSRGYLSAVPPEIHMGVGKDTIIDSLTVIWPQGSYETLKAVPADTTLHLDIANAAGQYYNDFSSKRTTHLKDIVAPIDFTHKDQASLEFSADPLIPFANTNEGPSIAIGDLDNNGWEDFFVGGGKGQPSALFLQDSLGNFKNTQQHLFVENAINEVVSQTFVDVDNDNDLDILVVYGGNEFRSGDALRPTLYLNNNGTLEKDSTQFSGIAINASKVASIDLENDGDMDIIITSDQVPKSYGITPRQFLFENDGQGNFNDITSTYAKDLLSIGNIKDLEWRDWDGNGFKDLIVVGHWMPISLFLNDGKSLSLQKKIGLEETNGWWNTIISEDFDKDGDIDFVAGNWGLNSKFRASKERPITLYSNDFDNNGSTESLVTYFYGNKETPFASKDELVKQMPFLNKKFLSYKDFAKATMNELFTENALKTSLQKKVYELASCYFENDGSGNFTKRPLTKIVQASTVQDMITEDFDGDGFLDLLLVGNTHEISTQLGRMDASHGLILQNSTNGGFNWLQHQDFDIAGAARSIEKIRIGNADCISVGINGSKTIFLTKNEER